MTNFQQIMLGLHDMNPRQLQEIKSEITRLQMPSMRFVAVDKAEGENDGMVD